MTTVFFFFSFFSFFLHLESCLESIANFNFCEHHRPANPAHNDGHQIFFFSSSALEVVFRTSQQQQHNEDQRSQRVRVALTSNSNREALNDDESCLPDAEMFSFDKNNTPTMQFCRLLGHRSSKNVFHQSHCFVLPPDTPLHDGLAIREDDCD